MIAALDTETDGLNGPLHRLAWLTEEGEEGWLKPSDLPSAEFLTLMEEADKLILFNIKYDAHILRKVGIELPWDKCEDALIMASLLQHGREEKSLLALSLEYLDYDGGKDLDLHDWLKSHGLGMGSMISAPDPMLRSYTMQQLLNTLCLYVYWEDAVPKESYESEKKLCRVLFEMEDRGVLVDGSVLEEARGKLEEASKDCRAQITEIVGQPSFNPASNKQVGEYLKSKEFSLPETPTGQAKVDAETLAPFVDDPFVGRILSLRGIEKLRSTYIDGLLQAIEADGCIRTSFAQTITRTGRLSSSQPNLQNIIGKEVVQEARYVREAFRIRPHYSTYGADWSQIEWRAAIHLSQDPVGIAVLLRGGDIHSATAKMLGISRDLAKRLVFAILYGMGIPALAQILGMSREEAGALHGRFFAAYQQLCRFRKGILWKAKQEGSLMLPSGRALYLEPREYYKAFNYLVSGTAAEIVKKAMVDVAEILRGTRSHLLLQIHDELIIEIHEDEQELFPLCLDAMRNASDFPAPLDVSIWEGSWAEKQGAAPF